MNVSLPWFRKTGIVSLDSAVWKMSGLPSSSMSLASAPMPESGAPASGYATPATKPISSNVPLPRLWNRKLGSVSFATKRSRQSVAVVVGEADAHALADDLADARVFTETSVNVPSPLLWKREFGRPL